MTKQKKDKKQQNAAKRRRQQNLRTRQLQKRINKRLRILDMMSAMYLQFPDLAQDVDSIIINQLSPQAPPPAYPTTGSTPTEIIVNGQYINAPKLNRIKPFNNHRKNP